MKDLILKSLQQPNSFEASRALTVQKLSELPKYKMTEMNEVL